ncbi:methyltransferase [Streptosporangium pseudovulgare]|uniref:Hydroxyneurosporene-O-methyltransferase n=1 Tax=Streptosporangium pseudovulgare TaxID=35765 RepID=A0ABQ2RDB1_9ACTN|nr:methyltransferase [Streptosporangium pseudovulgare]GGQ20118.1 hydroxyneurosporene-O-methyltransferase [Streptosporangium pseudovulgare]
MTSSLVVDQQPAGPTFGSGGPQHHLLTVLAGKMISSTVCVLAQVGVADHMADGPRTVEHLAEATGTDPGMLYRFLRAAASVGIFAELPDGRFELTGTGEYLRSDVPGSLRYLAWLYGEESIWNCFGYAVETLRTGESTGPKVRGGKGWFEYMEEHPEYAEVFHKAMTGTSNMAAQVADSYDFSRFGHIADVGGGQGRLLAAILSKNPDARGLLFDQASAITGAAEVLEQYGVADRTECVVGDFFESVTPGPDAYLLKAILHDWNDDDSVAILRNIRAALGDKKDGRVFIVEAVVPDGNDWHFSKAMDIAMAVSLGSKERNLRDWRGLLSASGFELVGTTKTMPPHWIIEARPV